MIQMIHTDTSNPILPCIFHVLSPHLGIGAKSRKTPKLFKAEKHGYIHPAVIPAAEVVSPDYTNWIALT